MSREPERPLFGLDTAEYDRRDRERIQSNKRATEAGMKCPSCGARTSVVDSRPAEDGRVITRRRRCPQCNERFNTNEVEVGTTVQREVRRASVKREAKAMLQGLLKALEEDE